MNPKCPHFATCDQFYCAEIQCDFIVVIGIWWRSFVWTLVLSFCFSCSFSRVLFIYLFIYFSSTYLQASSAFNGVGIVKLMGRQSGFIAMYATIASGQVDIVLIPEVGKACLFCQHSFDAVTVVVLCSFVTFCTTSW